MSKLSLPKAALLCIDDDQTVLECEKGFLETFGYTVVTASSGRDGLELARLHSFDLVIVDYSMPEMNGHEFAIAMRRLKPLAPIIMLSGAVDVPEQALKLVDAFVPKGCLASRLLQAIELLCGSELLPSHSQLTHDRGKTRLRENSKHVATGCSRMFLAESSKPSTALFRPGCSGHK